MPLRATEQSEHLGHAPELAGTERSLSPEQLFRQELEKNYAVYLQAITEIKTEAAQITTEIESIKTNALAAARSAIHMLENNADDWFLSPRIGQENTLVHEVQLATQPFSLAAKDLSEHHQYLLNTAKLLEAFLQSMRGCIEDTLTLLTSLEHPTNLSLEQQTALFSALRQMYVSNISIYLRISMSHAPDIGNVAIQRLKSPVSTFEATTKYMHSLLHKYVGSSELAVTLTEQQLLDVVTLKLLQDWGYTVTAVETIFQSLGKSFAKTYYKFEIVADPHASITSSPDQILNQTLKHGWLTEKNGVYSRTVYSAAEQQLLAAVLGIKIQTATK